MTTLKLSQFDTTNAVLESASPDVRSFLEEAFDRPVPRREMIDFLVSQIAMNLTLSAVVVDLAREDIDSTRANLEKLMDVLQKHTGQSTDMVARLMSAPNFEIEVGEPE